MNLNITYVGGAANNAAPTGFYSAVSYVVNYFDTLFTNNVTVNIDVSYGNILNPNTNTFQALGNNDLGTNFEQGWLTAPYANTRTILLNENAPGSNILPTSSPEPGNYNLYIDQAQAKALGYISGNGTALDGTAGFASNVAWDFSPTATPTSNQYYLVGTLEHEFTEVMGRDSRLDLTNEYSIMDLYRAAAPHVLQTGTGGPSYFSIDGGVTNLDNWNNFSINSGDLGDWARTAAPDSFLDNSNPGVINGFTKTDITLMQSIGWTVNSTAIPITPTTVLQEILGLYAALYNRATDFNGVAYWVGVVGQAPDALGVTTANAGTTAVTLGDAAGLGELFVNTQATYFNATYGSLNDSAFITSLYTNIGGNATNVAAGIAYWAGLLETAEAAGQSVQAARAGLVGLIVHDMIDYDVSVVAPGYTAAQWAAVVQRQETIDNKIAVSEALSVASQQPGGNILVAQTINDAAFVAATSVLQGITYDPATVTAAITGINNAVAHQNLLLI